MPAYSAITSDLLSLANPAKAKILSRFFKTGAGQYGEGDVFLGVMVPQQREVANRHWKEASLQDIEQLLSSKAHEHRLVALLILVKKYEKTQNEEERKEICNFYLHHAHLSHINNWDLVDLSAPRIVGKYLLQKDKSVLMRLARSNNLWERRIAVLATFEFIANRQYDTTLRIAQMLLQDKHDLIHKAVGWMLREMGKRGGEKELHAFLREHAAAMSRTMLRYAIERMGEGERRKYMRAPNKDRR